MDGEPVLFDDLENGEPKKTSFDKRFDAFRDIAKEFGQPISMAGVMSAAEIEDAIWEWGQKGIKSKYFKRWFGDWELARELSVSNLNWKRKGATSFLKTLQGKDIENLETGIKARIARNQIGKLVSAAALEKSEANGFKPNLHFAALTKLDGLFKHAILMKSSEDEGGNKNVKSIKRFVAPIKLLNRIGVAYLTVKESVNAGHRVYSLELMEIKKVEDEIERLKVEAEKQKAEIEKLGSLDGIASNDKYTAPRAWTTL